MGQAIRRMLHPLEAQLEVMSKVMGALKGNLKCRQEIPLSLRMERLVVGS